MLGFAEWGGPAGLADARDPGPGHQRSNNGPLEGDLGLWEPARLPRRVASKEANAMATTGFTRDQALDAARQLAIDWVHEDFDVEALRQGMNVELEHGTRDPDTDVTHDDPVTTAKIALAHLREFPDYYERLASMEARAEAAQALATDEDLGVF